MKNTIYHFIACCCILFAGDCDQAKPSTGSLQSDQAYDARDTSVVYGVFEGRIPCQEIARELNLKVTTACDKRKVMLTLYKDAVTHRPGIYKIHGMGGRTGEGNWHIVKGMAIDPQAVLYELNTGDRSLFLYKGDDNVLFFLDKDKSFLPGNEHFSYTLNRVRNNASWAQWLYLANRGSSF